MVRIVVLRLLESYFQHRWFYLFPIIIVTVAGGVFVVITPPKYVSGGQLYVEQGSLLADLTQYGSSESWWTTASESTINELNELMSTKAFVRSAIQKTSLEQNMSAGTEAVDETIDYFRKAVSFEAVSEKLVGIYATSEDPTLAHQMVIATMDAYVQWKINTDYQESIAARTFFDGLIQPYTEQVDNARAELVAYLDQYPVPVRGERPPEEEIEIARLQAEIQAADDRLKSAQGNEESARLSMAQSESVTRQTFMVIDQPELPREPEVSLKDMLVNVAIFVAVGLFLSVVGIVGGALLDQTLRFPIDVRYGLSLPVLAMVPVATHGTPLPEPVFAAQNTPAVQSSAQSELATTES